MCISIVSLTFCWVSIWLVVWTKCAWLLSSVYRHIFWRETIWEQPLAAGSQACPLPRRVPQSCTHGVWFAKNQIQLLRWILTWEWNPFCLHLRIERNKCHPQIHRWQMIHAYNVCRCRDVDNVEEHSEGPRWHMKTQLASQPDFDLCLELFQSDIWENHKFVQVSLRQIAIKLVKRHLSVCLIFDFRVQHSPTQMFVLNSATIWTTARKLELLWHAPWALPGSSENVMRFSVAPLWSWQRFRLPRIEVITRRGNIDCFFYKSWILADFSNYCYRIVFFDVFVWKNCDQHGIAVMVVLLLLIGPSVLRAAARIPVLKPSRFVITFIVPTTLVGPAPGIYIYIYMMERPLGTILLLCFSPLPFLLI